jgi:N-methylhydantoinase A
MPPLLEEAEEERADLIGLHGGLVYRRMVTGQHDGGAGAGVGVDVGGTFTDVVVTDPASGRLHVAKVPSTPADQAAGVLAGLERAGADPAAIGRFVHGTTVATNAVLERRGARTVLVVTEGFRDLLEIARQTRPKLYDLFADRPAPLVPRSLVVEAPERIAVDGRVVVALEDAAGVAAAVRALAPGSVAVCFLHAFVRPEHERAVAEALEGGGGPETLDVSVSSEILPVFREYERASTTVLNAYVAPAMRTYLGALAEALGERGLPVPVEVVRSGGGTFDAALAARFPVHTLLSGPAAGAWGAATLAGLAGCPDAIAFDMGGTSTDVTLIEGGRPRRTSEGSIDGLPFGVAATDIHTIGSGGGSVAWRDEGGSLRVGPRSAGAVPGPACYGSGGLDATVTDAFMGLGMLDERSPLGGSLELDPAAAAAAIARLASEFGLAPRSCADGILRVVEAQVTKALRVVSVERGKDPRGFALLPFGGAGPLLQGPLSRALGSSRVILPRSPGVLSALGLLTAPMAVDLARTRLTPLEGADPAMLDAVWRQLHAHADGLLADQGSVGGRSERSADCRYVGQAFELEVPAPDPDPGTLTEAFHRAHRERYGYEQRGTAVEVVTLRIRAEDAGRGFDLPTVPDGRGAASARAGERLVVIGDADVTCPVYRRDGLGAGDRLNGPALLTAVDSTCLVLPGQRGEVDGFGTMILEEA